MQIRFSLLFFLIGLGCSVHSGTVEAGRSICGVSVRGTRCFRELRKLRRACQKTPRICGRTYASTTSPRLGVVRNRCHSLRRLNRARWSRGLCGVRLFSSPKTYCGMKGIEVAVACVRKQKKKETTHTAAVVKPPKTRQPLSRPPVHPREVSSQPLAAKTSKYDARQSKHEAVQGGFKRSVAPTKRLTTPSSSSSTTRWLLFFQLLTMALVVYLLFRRRSPRTTREWERTSQWDASFDVLENTTRKTPNSDEVERVARSVEKLEDRFQAWQGSFEEEMERVSSPLYIMQSQADALFNYYIKLAEKVSESAGHALQPQGSLDVRQCLLESKDKLRWLFNAHRELPSVDSPIDELKATSWHHVQHVLETLGHISWSSKLHAHMANGHFTAAEYIQRMSADQAQRFSEGQDLRSFIHLGEEFLQCLENVYQSNLHTLKEACEIRVDALTPEEERDVFYREYVLEFLLESLPAQLQELTHRSSPVHSGALVDQFIQFIESELESAELQLFPILDEEMIDTVHSRLIYLLHAGVKSKDNSVVLRRPDASIMSVQPTPPLVETSSSESPEPTLDVRDASEANEALNCEVDVTGTGRISWFDAPAEEKESNAASSTQHTMASPSIGHPDSDPPESQGQSERLPSGPLPHIKDVTQNFIAGVSEADLSRKITHEYGLFEDSISPDKNS